MKPLPHEYEIDVTGAPAGYATASAAGIPDLTAAPPLDYDGPGDAWSPEHLLLAAVGFCFLFTFRAAASAGHAEFITCDARAGGTVARAEGVTRFTDIVIRAAVTAPPGHVEAVRHAIEKAERRCLVSASLVTPVRVEATINGVPARGAAA